MAVGPWYSILIFVLKKVSQMLISVMHLALCVMLEWWQFFFLFLFMAAPAAYGSSPARGRIGASAEAYAINPINFGYVTYDAACISIGSLTHWGSQGLTPRPHGNNLWSLTPWTTVGTLSGVLLSLFSLTYWFFRLYWHSVCPNYNNSSFLDLNN